MVMKLGSFFVISIYVFVRFLYSYFTKRCLKHSCTIQTKRKYGLLTTEKICTRMNVSALENFNEGK